MSMPVYRIGPAAVSMVSLESIGIPLPKASPVDYAEYITLGDGSNRGVGWLCCEWRFAHLTLTQLAVLRGYCTGESAAVYIQTLTESGTYGNYSATMVWPVRRPPKVDFVLDFVVEFRGMVAV